MMLAIYFSKNGVESIVGEIWHWKEETEGTELIK